MPKPQKKLAEILENKGKGKTENPYRLKIKESSIPVSYSELGETKDVIESFMDGDITPVDGDNPLGD